MSTPISKQELNAAVKALEKLDRRLAVDVLAKFGVLTTAKLQPELWQAVFDACTEALKKFDGIPS